MLVVIVGFPVGSGWKSTGTKVGIPAGVAAVVAAVLTWASVPAGEAAVPVPAGEAAVPVPVPVPVPEQAVGVDVDVDESVDVDVDESVDVDVDESVDVDVDVTELPTKAVAPSKRRRRAKDLAPLVVPALVEENVDAPEEAHPDLGRLSRDSVPVVAPKPKVEPEPKPKSESEPQPDSPRIQLARPHRPTPETPDTSGQLDPAELSLLQSARQALDAGNPRRALSRIREHARRFGDSALAPERDATAAEAHCALGHERSARPFLRRLERAGQGRLAKTIRERCD